jgi:hypothetical protein
MHSMKKIVFFLSILMIAASTEAQTITINPLTQLTYCEGETAAVSYRSTGSFDPSNVFVVQLSAPDGSFSGWSIIGRASADSGSILVTFTQAGTYRLRVASTDPGEFSNDNGANIYIVGPPVPNIYALTSYEVSMDIGANQIEPQIVGAQDDSIPIFDLYDDSAVRHEWTFDQDANISSSTLANPTVKWASGGIKTGSVETWNSEGCTDTASLAIELISCDPVIPADAHIVTGTETGDYQDVWIKPGGLYHGGAGAAFIEPGGEMDPQNLGGWTVDRVYAKRGASFIIGSNINVYIADLDTAASFSNSGNVTFLLHCDSLQFDYSLIQPSGVEISPPSNITILQSGDHLFANADGLPIEIRVSNILGAGVLSHGGNGALDVDLSALPAGVYFAVVQSGSERQVQKIAVVH